MNRSKHLILHNGKDITGDVMRCEYNPATQKHDITFQSGKIYNYNYTSIEWVKAPKTIIPTNVRIVHLGRELFGIQTISVFHAKHTDYWYVRFSNGSERTYNADNLIVSHSCLDNDRSKNCINYLRDVSSVSELKNDDGEALLKKQYDKLEFVGTDTVMASYVNPQKHKIRTLKNDNLIFPFGGNSSQFKAVANALSNQHHSRTTRNRQDANHS